MQDSIAKEKKWGKKRGGAGRLMANTILNFHFDNWNPSLIFLEFGGEHERRRRKYLEREKFQSVKKKKIEGNGGIKCRKGKRRNEFMIEIIDYMQEAF